MDLDSLTAGFQKGDLIIVAARPSVGKTAFAVNVARHVAVSEKTPALFVSLEQSRIELMERLLCCQGLIDSHRLKTMGLRPDERARALDAREKLDRSPLFIDDRNGLTVLQIAASVRQSNRRHGIAIAIIDYLQLIAAENAREPRHEQVAGFSRRLKSIARELAIPVICLAQLNREVERRGDGRPKLSDLRESGAIEQDADAVVLLHRPGENQNGIVEALLAKHRNGPTGTVSLLYVKQHMRFGNCSKREGN